MSKKMMLTAGVLVAAGLSASAATAGVRPGTVAPPSCLNQATALADGCATANAYGAVSVPTFFTNYAAQSGQGRYPVRPSWNVAGVDYPVGNYTSLDQLIDVRKSQPPGCSLRQYGSAMGLQCNGSGPLLIQGYRFDLSGGTFLVVSGSHTTITLDDDYFFNGPAVDRANGVLVQIGNDTGDLVITNSTFDGNGRVATAGLNYLIADTRAGNQRDIIKYNALFRAPQKGLATGPCGDTDIENNYFEELEVSSSHGEFTIDGNTACTKNNLVESFNTILQPAGAVRTALGGGITTMLYLSAGQPTRSWNHVVVSNNTVVVNKINLGSGPVASSSRVLESNYGIVYGDLKYVNNYIDPTGALSCYYYPTPFPAQLPMQGNINLLDGSSVNDLSNPSCHGRSLN